MNASIKPLGIDRLPVEERLALVEQIWDSIAADSSAVPLTGTQHAQLQKRMEEDDAHPGDVMSWEQVKASTLSRLGKGPSRRPFEQPPVWGTTRPPVGMRRNDPALVSS